jgi:predicted class III extradiol MEMO1 family dioxygenase
VDCDEGIFYPFGGVITTKEHGIGEHLPRIAKYFPNVKEVMPLILPTHREPNELLLQGKGKVLRIASVDFSHYLPEATAQINDEVSVIMLQS